MNKKFVVTKNGYPVSEHATEREARREMSRLRKQVGTRFLGIYPVPR